LQVSGVNAFFWRWLNGFSWLLVSCGKLLDRLSNQLVRYFEFNFYRKE